MPGCPKRILGGEEQESADMTILTMIALDSTAGFGIERDFRVAMEWCLAEYFLSEMLFARMSSSSNLHKCISMVSVFILK